MLSVRAFAWRNRRWWLQRLRNIAFIYLGYLLLLFLLQRWMIFPRWALPKANPGIAAQVPGLVRLTLPLAQGHVEAWFLPGVGVSPEHPGPAVIFAHGNGELIEFWLGPMQRYRELGISVLLPEYRGYGVSGGSPSEEALTRDFVQFYDLLAWRPEVDPSRIVIHGRSVGGGVACALAARRHAAALVLQSTFTDLGRMAHRYLAPAFLVRDRFDNLAVVRSLDVPVFIAHGRRDRVIPFENGVALASAAKHATFLPYDSDHNDCPPDWDAYMSSVTAFLEQAHVVRARPLH